VFDAERAGHTGPVPVGASDLAQELREQHLIETQRVIDSVSRQFEKVCEHSGIPYRLVQDKGNPFQSLIGFARYHDLIVCDAQHLFEHGVVEEPPAELARLVAAGVRPLLAVTEHPLRVLRTLVAYSGSMESANALRQFVQLRLWHDTKIRIVTFKLRRGGEERLLADAADYCVAHDYDVTTELVPEPAKFNILPYAQQWDADLIVMGNSNKRLLLRRIFGETMLHTVKHADRPLFLAQ